MNKPVQFILMAVYFVLLTSCELTFSPVESQMKPPRLTEQQDQIAKALKEAHKDNFLLVYPSGGNEGASYIICDLDDTPTSEALVFTKESEESTTVRIHILAKVDDKWRVVWSESSVQQVTGVEKVSFVEKNDGVDLVIGFPLVGDERMAVMIYQYREGRLDTVFETTCLAHEVFDFAPSSTKKLLTLNRKESTLPSVDPQGTYKPHGVEAVLYGIHGNQWRQLSKTNMNGQPVHYSGVSAGKLIDGTPAIYVDSIDNAGQQYTEILTAPNDNIQNLIREDLLAQTQRNIDVSLRDFKHDGVYAIPRKMAFAGYAQTDTKMYMVEWYYFSTPTGQFVKYATTYSDYQLGYELDLPARWTGNVSAQYDKINNEITFFVLDPSAPEDASQPLLQIQVLQRSLQSSGLPLPMGYQLLTSSRELTYVYQIKQSATEFDLSQAELFEMFRLLA